jgi:hypothetical protein
VAQRLSVQSPPWLPRLAAYGIGSVSAMWLFERTVTSL